MPQHSKNVVSCSGVSVPTADPGRIAAFSLALRRAHLMPTKKSDEDYQGGKGIEQEPSSSFPSARNIRVHSTTHLHWSLPEPAKGSVTSVTLREFSTGLLLLHRPQAEKRILCGPRLSTPRSRYCFVSSANYTKM
jgi:hypothetical protein